MKNVLSLVLMLSYFFTLGQVSSADKKKLLQLIGEDFVAFPANSEYPFGREDEVSRVDRSIFLPGDTTGIHFQNEYCLFRDFIHFREDAEYFSWMNPNVVTVGEYTQFKEYVRDSIARVMLYFGIDRATDALEYLNLPKKKSGSHVLEFVVSYSSRSSVLERYGLNWEKKFSYTDPNAIAILADMYLPQRERFRKVKEFDERKFSYTHYDFFPGAPSRDEFEYVDNYIDSCRRNKTLVESHTQLVVDIPLWARSATHDDDELGILSQLYGKMNPENPVVGLLGTQAKAFCDWKQRNLQKEVNRAGMNYDVVVTLPTINQLTGVETIEKLQLEAWNYTDQWRITQEEYQTFMNYIVDSFTRRLLYFELKDDREAAKFLRYEKIYFDEGGREFEWFNSNSRRENSELFPLNFKTKIKKKDPQVSDLLNEVEDKKIMLTYRYFTMRTQLRATPPSMYFDDKWKRWFSVVPNENSEVDLDNRLVYTSGLANELGHESGVALLWKLNEYMEQHEVKVMLPESELKGEDESLVQTLSYEQAMAFYNWKFPIKKFGSTSNWHDFVYPSEVQFNAIQRGESVVVPAHYVEFPTPLFRYVVHVFPK